MCDINIYRLRIGVFIMPRTKSFKFNVTISKFKRRSYKLSPSLFSWLLLLSLVVYGFCVSEQTSERTSQRVLGSCRLPLELYNSKNGWSIVKADVNFYARYTYETGIIVV